MTMLDDLDRDELIEAICCMARQFEISEGDGLLCRFGIVG